MQVKEMCLLCYGKSQASFLSQPLFLYCPHQGTAGVLSRAAGAEGGWARAQVQQEQTQGEGQTKMGTGHWAQGATSVPWRTGNKHITTGFVKREAVSGEGREQKEEEQSKEGQRGKNERQLVALTLIFDF